MWSSTFLDEEGRPSFHLLQNYGSANTPLIYYVFDVLILAGRDVMREPLDSRRRLLEEHVLPKLDEPIRYSQELGASLPDLIQAAKAQGLEGLVAGVADGAARLWGAAEGLLETVGGALAPSIRWVRDRHIEPTRKSLGDTSFETSRSEGRAMLPVAAIEFARQRALLPG